MKKRLKKKAAKNREKRKEEIFRYAAYGDLEKIQELLNSGIKSPEKINLSRALKFI